MRRFPSPPVVAGTFSGFMVGVLLTLLVTGVLSRTSRSSAPSATSTPPPPVAADQMLGRATKIVRAQLGPSVPGQHYPRLVTVQLEPAPPPSERASIPGRASIYRSVDVVFNLNDNPLGRIWRLRSAKADVFRILKALYTSGLPVYNTQLVGHFTEKNGTVLNRAMVAVIHYDVAARIPWKHWGREFEERLWKTLSVTGTDPRFA